MKRIFFIISSILFCFSVNAQGMFGEVEYNKILNFHGNYLTFSKPMKLMIFGEKRRQFRLR